MADQQQDAQDAQTGTSDPSVASAPQSTPERLAAFVDYFATPIARPDVLLEAAEASLFALRAYEAAQRELGAREESYTAVSDRIDLDRETIIAEMMRGGPDMSDIPAAAGVGPANSTIYDERRKRWMDLTDGKTASSRTAAEKIVDTTGHMQRLLGTQRVANALRKDAERAVSVARRRHTTLLAILNAMSLDQAARGETASQLTSSALLTGLNTERVDGSQGDAPASA